MNLPDGLPRWYGDERGLPPCRDPHHRHLGSDCERWALPPVPWVEDIGRTIEIAQSRHPFRVTHHHRPSGCTVAVEGDDLDRLHRVAAAELTTMITERLRSEAADLFRRSDNALMTPRDPASITRVGDLRERAQRMLDLADTVQKAATKIDTEKGTTP